jgi:CDGSH-type Zn-finger protein
MRQRTRIMMTTDGPLLVQGDVDLILPDGTVMHPQRRIIALCLCNRSQVWPFCDTSHRETRQPKGTRQAMVSHSAGNMLAAEVMGSKPERDAPARDA